MILKRVALVLLYLVVLLVGVLIGEAIPWP